MLKIQKFQAGTPHAKPSTNLLLGSTIN